MNLVPMRAFEPMPRRTMFTSAPMISYHGHVVREADFRSQHGVMAYFVISGDGISMKIP
jgi:hypothetical protein